VAAAEDVVATCEDLLAEGKIRSFGTAQDDAETVAVFARSDGCVAVQTQVNVFGWTAATLDAAHPRVVSVGPVTACHGHAVRQVRHRPKAGDVRLDTPYWDYFDADRMPGWLDRIDTVRKLLTVGGRTLVQGALGYLLALDSSIIPLPGIRCEQQARENASVLAVGPLPQAETTEITALLADSPERR
jgi:aryl-alcohol dehydrogenase-like predicted oxidoreductase